MKKKITFKDWEKGKALFKTCDVYIPVSVKIKIIRFDWNDLSIEDAKKIQEKQKELFETECVRILEKWKQIFKSNLSLFDKKNKYIANEMNDMRAILSIDKDLNVIHHELPLLNHKKLVFEENSLPEIRDYFHEVILLYKKRNYNFIHSPNFSYQHLNKVPNEIYAQVCWDYYNWLLEMQSDFAVNSNAIDFEETLEIENKVPSTKKAIKSLPQLFNNNNEKVKVVRGAINELNITKDFSERQITAFVDASKLMNVLPLHANIRLMKIIYFEIGKPIPQDLKSRNDGKEYSDMKKIVNNYYALPA